MADGGVLGGADHDLVGYTALSPAIGSWIGLAGALITSLAVLRAMPQPGYAVAVVWALIGVMVSNLSGNLPFLVAAGVGAVVVRR